MIIEIFLAFFQTFQKAIYVTSHCYPLPAIRGLIKDAIRRILILQRATTTFG